MQSQSGIITKHPKLLELRRIKLTSPILHIGSEVQKLNPFEYLQNTDYIYIPNQEALARALHKRGYLQQPKPWERIQDLESGKALTQYIQAIQDKSDQKVEQIIEQALGKEWWEAQDKDGKPIFPESGIIPKWFKHRINHELRPMIRNAFGQLYIPGSSIKGAIRTAIAYYMLSHEPQRVSDIEQTLRERLNKQGEIGRSKKNVGKKLFMKDLFSNCLLKYQERDFTSDNESNTDFMRAVKVADCNPLLPNDTINMAVLVEVLVSSFYKGIDKKPAKFRSFIYAEMAHNVETEFTLSLDKTVDENTGIIGMLSWFTRNDGIEIPFQTIEDILNICQEFAQVQWNYERKYWQRIQNNKEKDGNKEININLDKILDFYSDTKCPFTLRLGWASGMLGTTIGLHLHDEIRRCICDECGSPKNRAPGFEAPKSRRTVMNQDGETEFAPGWVKLEILPNLC
ncbi:MAG: type III-A CRISPR-associated RAMP protein Csm5 [Scytonema sp. RU_4_4]|nr:type III-A CRISPR-associated RAMP protein Csm5 [Scytonema sp. RU_4_4]